jgi:YHS domain-containing protein
MSKINAMYLVVVAIVAVAIFLSVAASNDSNSNQQSANQAVQKDEGCCSGETLKAENMENPWNEVCPVMGGKVNPQLGTVEYNEKLYGFCCPGCVDKFAQEPEKYSANLSEYGKEFIK